MNLKMKEFENLKMKDLENGDIGFGLSELVILNIQAQSFK
jgi:translation elongation factor EF-1beta